MQQSAPGGRCGQRGDENLANYCLSQAASDVLSYLGGVKKRKGGCSRQVPMPSSLSLSPADGSCFCGRGDNAGSTVHVLRTAAHKSAEAAGRGNTNMLPYKIFKGSCEFGFLLISSPDLYFSSIATGSESTQRYPQSPLKYFAVFT